MIENHNKNCIVANKFKPIIWSKEGIPVEMSSCEFFIEGLVPGIKGILLLFPVVRSIFQNYFWTKK